MRRVALNGVDVPSTLVEELIATVPLPELTCGIVTVAETPPLETCADELDDVLIAAVVELAAGVLLGATVGAGLLLLPPQPAASASRPIEKAAMGRAGRMKTSGVDGVYGPETPISRSREGLPARLRTKD
jgi:hypothetical protein